VSKQEKAKESDWKKIGPCLYRYKSGVYYGLVKLRGKQIRKSLETSDLEQARRELKTWKNDLELTDPTLSARTLETHAEVFLKSLTGAASTQDNTRRTIAKLLKDWSGPRVISKIKPSDCTEWLAKYGELRQATRNKMIQDMRNFFAAAVEDKVIARSPAESVKYKKRPDIIRLTPDDDQFAAIVADLRSQLWNGHGRDDTADFVELAGTLGLGQAELSGIQRQHVNLKAGTIQILRQKTQTGFTIPIYPKARAIIERRMTSMPSEQSARLLPQDNCKKGLAAACKRLGFPNFEPRSLRRYFITAALRAGVDVATVAAWQGHKDGGALVLKTYGDAVRLEHSLKMAALLGGENSAELFKT